VEIIRDGEVVAVADNAAGAEAGTLAATVDVAGAGWLAARCRGRRRTSHGHALWAHTSPVYLRPTAARARRQADGRFFIERIDAATDWVATTARFEHDRQRQRVLELFADGRRVFEHLARA
jgi:hypothetical protein